jgi:hypothetical protein
MSNISAISWQVTLWLDDNDVHLVLELHAEMEFFSAISLKQHAVHG